MLDAAQIFRQSVQAQQVSATHGDAAQNVRANATAVQSGQAMGFVAEMMDDPLADLMDSMEELSFQFEEKSMKSIGERKLGRSQVRNPMLVAIQTWLKMMPDMPGGKFVERMLRQLRQMMASMMQRNQTMAAEKDVALGTLFKMLSEASKDPSHQFALIDILEQALSPEEKELQQLLSEAKAQLMHEKGSEIRAGLNLAEAVNEQAKTPEEMRELRDLYRGEVLGFKSPQDCFRSLLETRGAGRLADAIEFLLKGCGLDLQSPSPSQSPEELRRIILDLQCVQVLKTCLDKLSALAGKMNTQFGEPCLLNGEKLTGRVMEFTKMPFVTFANIASLISTCGITKLLAQLYFCTGLIDVFRQLSPRLFDQEADRFKLEDAAQEHLDGLVKKQEEEEKREREGGSAA